MPFPIDHLFFIPELIEEGMLLVDDISTGSCFQFCNQPNAICATSSMNDLLIGSKLNENNAVSGGDTSDTDTDETDVSEVSSKGIIESIFDLFGGFLNSSDNDEEIMPPCFSEPLKQRKSVRFDRIVKVILIRNRFEYLQNGLIPKLWFFEEDYTAAKLERMQEIKEQRRLEMLEKQSKLHAGREVGKMGACDYSKVLESNGSSISSEEEGQTDIDGSQSSGFSSNDSNNDDYVIEGEAYFCGDVHDGNDDYYVEDLSPVYPVKQDADSIKWNIVSEIEKSSKKNEKNICKYAGQIEVNDSADNCIKLREVGGTGNHNNENTSAMSSINSRVDDSDPEISTVIRRCQTFRVGSRDNILQEDM
mgnify:CR=1 FL=1